jgi:hypothetical protein
MAACTIYGQQSNMGQGCMGQGFALKLPGASPGVMLGYILHSAVLGAHHLAASAVHWLLITTG